MLLKTANPEIGGLQNSILGETLTFDIAQTELVHVVNEPKNHWITVLNL